MANATLSSLKINCLKRAGNNYNANDSAKLELAGGLINDCLGMIQAEVRESPYFNDLNNSVNTTASQAYVDLVDTDIIDILNVYQLSTDTKLTKISRQQFVEMQPDTTQWTGIPDMAYCVDQSLSVTGVNTFRLYLIPTPSSAIALKYDYVKNIKFATEGSAGDTAFCPLPSVFNELIYAMFRPRFYAILDPADNAKMNSALRLEADAKAIYYDVLKNSLDAKQQIQSKRVPDNVRIPVAKTY